MPRRKRQASTFNLSFLDIMSCGFGAVVLVFLIIDHSLEIEIQTVNAEVLSEVNLLEDDIREGEAGLVRLRNALDEADLEIVEADGLARSINSQINEYSEINAVLTEQQQNASNSIVDEKKALADLESSNKQISLEVEVAEGQSALSFVGDGNRQYLSGLKLLGKRTLIMLDYSASMLSDQLVKIKLLQFEKDIAKKKNAKKWRQAKQTVRWLVNNLAKNSDFQVLAFNSEPHFVLEDEQNKWISSSNVKIINNLDERLSEIVPDQGTNLFKAFKAIQALSPPPDNIVLITDGLPTLGEKEPRAEIVNQNQRITLFNEARDQLPPATPVNVLLLPLRGDRAAPGMYWRLARGSEGALLSIANDWP